MIVFFYLQNTGDEQVEAFQFQSKDLGVVRVSNVANDQRHGCTIISKLYEPSRHIRVNFDELKIT